MANKNMNTKKVEKVVKKNTKEVGVSREFKTLIIITITVLLFLGLFYLLTVLILDNDTNSGENDDKMVEVQHDEILVGTSFSVKDSEYYVLYYETADDEISTDMSSLVSDYRSSNAALYLYTVDMSNAFNSAFNSDEGNSSAVVASELRIAGPTLIKFSDGKISQYVEGVDSIKDVLK